MMAHPFLFIVAMVLIALAIPCRFDPAIRLKEWNEKKRLERKK